MFLTSDIIGKELISLSDCQSFGIIEKIYFDKTLSQAMCFEVTDERQAIGWQNIFSVSDAVIIAKADLTPYPKDNTVFPLTKAFYTGGSCIGEVTDVAMLQNGKVIKILAGDLSFSPTRVYSATDDLVLIKNRLPKKIVATVVPTIVYENKSTTNRNSNFNFLYGKKVDKTIFNHQGEVMIKQFAIITPTIVAAARKNGKLIELSLHSIKK
ncbi:MAG: hypothetical protein RR086_04145 [Clostridia bacterium]